MVSIFDIFYKELPYLSKTLNNICTIFNDITSQKVKKMVLENQKKQQPRQSQYTCVSVSDRNQRRSLKPNPNPQILYADENSTITVVYESSGSDSSGSNTIDTILQYKDVRREISADRDSVAAYASLPIQQDLALLLESSEDSDELYLLANAVTEMICNAAQHSCKFDPDSKVHLAGSRIVYMTPETGVGKKILIEVYTTRGFYEPSRFKIAEVDWSNIPEGNQGLGSGIIADAFDRVAIMSYTQGEQNYTGILTEKDL